MNEWIHLLIFSTNVCEPHTAFQTLECVHGVISKREKTWENMRNFFKQQNVIFQISQVFHSTYVISLYALHYSCNAV